MPVQQIRTHWDEDIVEARVTISVSRLNDLLRMLAEASNRHEEEIDDLKNQLAEHLTRTEKLETDMDAVKPDGEKQRATDTAIDQLTIQLERTRRDFEHRLDTGLKSNRQQHEGFDESISNLKDDVLKQGIALKEVSTKNTTNIAENKARLDALRIPDVTGLNSDVDALKGWRHDANERLLTCSRFVRLWGVTRDNLAALCGGRRASMGIGGDVEPPSMLEGSFVGGVVQPHTTTTTSTPTPQSPMTGSHTPLEGSPIVVVGPSGSGSGSLNPSPNFNSSQSPPPPVSGGSARAALGGGVGSPTIPTPAKGAPPGLTGTGGIQAERTEYIHSLPAFEVMWNHLHKQEKKATEYIDYKTQVLGNKLTEKVSKHEIAELANELKDQHSQVRQTVDFLDRRLQEQDELQGRVVKAEERIKFMHHNKADIAALDLKADVGIVQQISSEVVDVREDLGDVFSRLHAQGSHSPRGIDDAGRLIQRNSIIPGGVDPRMSVSVLAAAAASSASGSPSGALGGASSTTPMSQSMSNKRFTDFAEMIASLERRKADRSELTALQDYLERVEHRVGGIGGGSAFGNKSMGASQLLPTTDPHGGISVMSRVTSGGAAAASLTPTKPAALGSSSNGGGIAGGAGDISNHSLVDMASPLRPGTGAATGGGVKVRPGTGGSAKGASGRLGSTGSHGASMNASIGMGDTRMEGHGLPTADPGARPFLGRGLVGVRDSGGGSVPATIGFHKPQFIYKGNDDEADEPPL